MTAPHETLLSVSYECSERARRIQRSLQPEIDDIDGDRTTATLHRERERLDIQIEAADLVALRAGINTWLTLLGVAEDSDDAASSVVETA